jgi:hypothetical protein
MPEHELTIRNRESGLALFALHEQLFGGSGPRWVLALVNRRRIDTLDGVPTLARRLPLRANTVARTEVPVTNLKVQAVQQRRERIAEAAFDNFERLARGGRERWQLLDQVRGKCLQILRWAGYVL